MERVPEEGLRRNAMVGVERASSGGSGGSRREESGERVECGFREANEVLECRESRGEIRRRWRQ